MSLHRVHRFLTIVKMRDKTSQYKFALIVCLNTVALMQTVLAAVTMQDIAHRGMWDKDVPQNTVESIKRADADAVRVAGLEFRFWGVNSLEDLRQAKLLGVSGFTCNYWHKAFEWARELGGIELLK